jgi:hypothetical protein
MIFAIVFNDSAMRKNPPFFAILLMLLQLFQAISALFGGFVLIYDPSGGKMQMPLTWLKNSPFDNFLVPGIILFLLLGILPLFTLYSLIARPKWKWANILNIYPDRHFAWTYSLYLGIMLSIWITVQIFMVGYGSILQTVFAAMGILITVVCLIPGVMDFYSRNEEPTKGEWRTL